MSLDDSMRRFANQAFFGRLTVTDDDAIDGQPGTPFDVLFNPQIHNTAAIRQAGTAKSRIKTENVAGLKNDALVDPRRLEPSTFCMKSRSSYNADQCTSLGGSQTRASHS